MAKKTTMYIPQNLLDEAMSVTGANSKTMAVVLGLEEIIRKKRLEALIKLKGSGALGLSRGGLNRMRWR